LNCERFEALLTDYLEGTLPKEDKAAMDQHMEECAACAKSLSDMRMLLQDLTGMDDSAQVPAEWSQSWRQVIRTEERTNMLKQSETPRRKPWRAWIGAVAAVAVLSAGSMAAREWIPAAGQPQASNSSIALQKSADTSEGMPLPAPGGAADMLYAATPEASGATRNSAAYSGAQSMKEEAAPAAGETVQGVKIIRTASYTLNTMQFEQDLEAVKALAAKYNGWVEYAGVSGDKSQGDMRFANLTLRIPTDSLDSFESGVTTIGRITDSNESATDVSESYSDTQMRLQTQKDKMDRLRALMNTTGELADLLAVENEIANTQYQIDSYESSLRSTDSRVNFTSVQIYLQEETAKDAASTKALTLGERILQGLHATWQAVCEFAQDLAVFLVMVLPVVIPAALILFIVLKVHKHRKQTKQQ
jgi:anti-sigma factor RsiW